jgi:hypothetical protein
MSKEEYASDVKDIDQGKFPNTDHQPIRRKPWWKFGGTDHAFVPVDAGYPASTNSASTSNTALDYDSVENQGRHVYNTDEAKEIYKPIEGYEGRHRFDPSFTWDPVEEQKLVRTVS